ncbi:AraC family transcriptional regulator [Paenibacillus sp. YN15]|uniref:helix-turn-helix transcriptional regulator n=1 Tax=Paenibacillus sp. YN15 TaxID=1742774 RepID=UPI000DCF430A|nr:AraC family transcriptional regulator [Paenibacillus sp. YN15]RAU93859.1 hypothetical protein DQG13_24945 [Paenibacillus sp. YN15]
MTANSVGFRYLSESSDRLYRIYSIGHQTIRSETYSWNGLTREGGGLIFQYTLQGTGWLEVGGERHKVGRGRGFLVQVPGDHKYAFDAHEAGEWEFIWLRFEGPGIEELWREWMDKVGPVAEIAPQDQPIVLLHDLYRDVALRQTGDRFAMSLRIYEWMLSLLRLLAGKQGEPAGIPGPCRNAAAMMNKFFAKDLTLGQVAEQAGVSPGHLCAMFTRYYGVTPIEYIRNRRLEHGAKLLRQTELSVSRIAVLCGYDNASYFGKVFHKVLGMAPSAYRQLPPGEIEDAMRLLE